MNTQRTITTIASMLAATMLLPACNFDKAQGNATAAITRDDIVDIDDLLEEDGNDAGAVKVGESAWLLAEARMQARNATSHIRSILHKIKVTLKHREPDATGVTVFDQPFGIWNGSDNGVDYRLLATRVTGKRVRYALYGRKPGGDSHPAFVAPSLTKPPPPEPPASAATAPFPRSSTAVTTPSSTRSSSPPRPTDSRTCSRMPPRSPPRSGSRLMAISSSSLSSQRTRSAANPAPCAAPSTEPSATASNSCAATDRAAIGGQLRVVSTL